MTVVKPKARIAIVLLLGIMLVSGLACGGPKPEIVGRDASEHLTWGDYYITVECQVLNRGDSGNVEVTATLESGGGYWKKSKTVYIAAGQTKEVMIDFREVGLFEGFTYSYTVWAKAK